MSGSNAYSTARDITHKQPAAGAGIPALLLFIGCGHKGGRTGSVMRGRLPMWCASCAEKRAKK
jgi:hypothetical protein